jgi:hypothetical protein
MRNDFILVGEIQKEFGSGFDFSDFFDFFDFFGCGHFRLGRNQTTGNLLIIYFFLGNSF